MRLVIPLAISLAAAHAHAQLMPTAHPLGDSVRLRGATWEVVPIVRLDSGKTKDSMAVRTLRRTVLVAPNHLIFEARTTDGGKWALFGWNNGALSRLAVTGEEFLAPDGRRKKIYMDRHFAALGPCWYAANLAVERRIIIPNSLYVTDGSTWKSVVHSGDTISIGGARMVVDDAWIREVEPDGSLLATVHFKDPKSVGIYRIRDGVFEKIIAHGDSLPTVGAAELPFELRQTFGIESGLKQLSTHGTGWLGVVRRHEGGRRYTDHVVLKAGTGAPRHLLVTEPFGMRDKAVDSISFASLSPSGEVLLQRGSAIGVIGTDGAWRQLIDARDVRPDGGRIWLYDAEWSAGSPSRALLSIALVNAEANRPISMAMLPRFFFYNGNKVSEVRADTSSALYSVFANLYPEDVAKHIPGYADAIGIALGRFAPTNRHLVMINETGAVVPAPAFRTSTGDIPVTRIVGWNTDREVIVRIETGLALLRRP